MVLSIGIALRASKSMGAVMAAFDRADAAPPATTYDVIAPEDLRFDEVCEGFAYWKLLCGERPFPTREEISPRAIARLLTNLILLKVIDGGADFEFVIVGDEVQRAYSASLLRRRLSDIAKDLPNSAAYWGGVYRDIVRTGKPWAVRFAAGLDGETRFFEAEAVLLPLGPREGAVDHILTFGKRKPYGS
jgi:hypothetical protein